VNAQNTRHAIGCLRRDECVTADHVAALLRSDGVDAEGERRKELSKCLLRLCEVTPRQPNPPLHHAGHGVFKVLGARLQTWLSVVDCRAPSLTARRRARS
jgi:hypothetical protein